MIEDKITLALQNIGKIKEKLKGIKKDVKAEEKIEDEQYLELKRSYKDLRMQVKDFEDNALSDLHTDASYKQLIEMKIKTEEELALAKEALFKAIASLPQKPFNMNLETEEGFLKVQVQPEMRVYINGKEEKKSI